MDQARQAYWQKRLRPIRLGSEPVKAQLAQRLQGAVVISGLLALVGLMILAIFASFGRPDFGALVAGVLVGPVAGFAWLDHAMLRGRTKAYLREDPGTRDFKDTPPR